MRFEKINDNKLKIILSSDELPNSDTLDKFMSDSSKARDSFLQLLDEADNAVGFTTKDYKIKIDARALRNGDFVFVITKLMQIKNNRIVVHPKKVLKEKESSSPYSIYQFENFDDFCNFCSFLKVNKINYLKSFSKSCQLYKYDKYYLVFKEINDNYKYISKFYTSITEFCKYYSSKELLIAALHEHGQLLMDNNALITCQKHFIK